MKNTLLITGLLLLTCLACNETAALLVSDTQNKGVLKVSEFFGSTVTYKWTQLYGSSGNETTFKLTIDSLNEGIAQFREHPVMLTSNAAVLFYNQLTDREKAELESVDIVLPFETEDADMYTFRQSLIDTLASIMPLIDTFMQHVIHQRYDAIVALCPWIDTASQREMKSDFQKIFAEWGAATNYTSLGFEFLTSATRPLYCRYYAMLRTDKQYIQFSLDFDPDLASQDILAFRANHLFQ